MKCPCGFEDDNQSNFDYHQKHCNHHSKRPDVRQKSISFVLTRLDKGMIGVFFIVLLLFLLTKIFGWS